MAYIEFHQALVTHRKLSKLAKALGVKRVTAAGHLAFLWCWALDNAPTGSLAGIEGEAIKEAAHWPKKVDTFIGALVAAGFIDDEDGLRLHDWGDYGGKLIVKRQRDRERKRKDDAAEVAGNSDGTPTEVAGRKEKTKQEQTREEQTREEQQPAARSNGYVPPGRPARWWYEHVMEKAPSPKIRGELDAIQQEHGFECVAIVFTRAKEEAEFPWGWAKKVFESCATQGHEPRHRDEPEEHDRLQELAEKVL